MSWLSRFAKSSIGAKWIMGITGLLLLLFVLQHMLGNLQLHLAWLAGPDQARDAMNAYAKFLKSSNLVLWGARTTLLLLVGLHIWSAVRLAMWNRASRPVGYTRYRPTTATWAGRTMIWSGLLVLAFIVYHLLHFTLGQTHPDHFALRDAAGLHDVYSMTVMGFMQPAVAIAYVVAMGLLCLHLWHGIRSMFQSMGMNHPRYNGLFHNVAWMFSLIIFLGFCSVPVAVLAGAIPLPDNVALAMQAGGVTP